MSTTDNNTPTLDDLVKALPDPVILGLTGPARDWYLGALIPNLSAQTGTDVTASQIDAAVAARNATNSASANTSPTQKPAWSKGSAPKMSAQVAAQLKSRGFGGDAA